MEEKDDIEKKQHYLRQEIIEKGYSPDEFANFLSNLKNEDASDLNSWSLDDLHKIVQQFKESQDSKKPNNPEETEEKEIKEEKEEKEIKKEKEEKEEIEKKDKNEEIKDKELENEIKEIKPKEEIIQIEEKKEKKENEIIIEKKEKEEKEEYIGSEDEDLWGNKIENKSKQSNLIIKCRKLEPSDLIKNRDKLKVQITNVEIKKDGLFSSSYYEFSIKNDFLNIDFKRRTNDFVWLKNKLTILFPNLFIPPLPKIKTKKDENYIQKKIYYLQSFINYIINNDILLSSQLFQDFISLTYAEFKNSREAFDILTPPKVPEDSITYDGNLDVSVLSEIDKKAYKIYNEIERKNELYNKLNISLKEIIDLIYNLNQKYLNISNIFGELSVFDVKSDILKNDKTNYDFTKLKGIFINCANEYEKKINYFEVYIRRFFKYIKNEIKEFHYMYKNYDKIRKTFIDITERKNFTADDNFRNIKKNFGFMLNVVYDEYKSLNKEINLRVKEHFSTTSKRLSLSH